MTRREFFDLTKKVEAILPDFPEGVHYIHKSGDYYSIEIGDKKLMCFSDGSKSLKQAFTEEEEVL